MVICGAFRCTHDTRKHKTSYVKGWHTVPYRENETELRQKWLSALKRDPPYPKNPSDFQLCGLHFTDDCFKNKDLKFELTKK